MLKTLPILLCALALRAHAGTAADDALDARVQRLAGELRCLVCQNQSLADSQAPLAVALRAELRERARHGDSDAQVLRSFGDRYGDFVRYRPPFNAATWALWLGPGVLLLCGAMTLGIVLSRLPGGDEAESP